MGPQSAKEMAYDLKRRLAVKSAPYHVDAFDSTLINVSQVPQSELDVVNRTRRNFFAWRGQFSPQLIETLLKYYANDSFHVADPFAGVGTTLFEAARRGSSATAVEINPAAFVMAETIRFVGMSLEARRDTFERARARLSRQILPRLPLFRSEANPLQPLVDEVAQIALAVLEKDGTQGNVIANALLRAMAGTRPVSPQAVLRALCEHEHIVMELPYSTAEYKVHLGDARDIPMCSGCCDLILTSPPYINVFNYHQNHRPAMELLRWRLLKVARSEIGANRKHRGNRFLTVIQYCLDMAEALLEMRRILRESGRAIIIMGRESAVRGVRFENGCIVGALAYGAGFSLALRQERKFKNKFGQLIYEDILHLVPQMGKAPTALAFEPRALAVHLLEQSIKAATADVAGDIRRAVGSAEGVMPSPRFRPGKCYQPCQGSPIPTWISSKQR